jgi:hypothetical protein
VVEGKRKGEAMKVKNINGRRQNSCNCGTWLDHWVKICGRPLPRYCAVKTCMGKPELGAHVQKDSSTDGNWYIIPLCVKHSMRAASLEIADTTTLVSAHVNETCGKQMPLGNFWPHELREAIGIAAISALERGPNRATLELFDSKPALVRPRILRRIPPKRNGKA